MSPGDHVICQNDRWGFPGVNLPVAGKIYTVAAIINNLGGFWISLTNAPGFVYKYENFKSVDPERIEQFTRMLVR